MRESPIFRRALILICAAYATLAHAATITSSADPGDTPTDAFDVSNPGNSYSLPAGAPGLNQSGGYDLRDMFGGEFGTQSAEPGHVVFEDGDSFQTVDRVNVTLANAVSLKHFDLWLADDGANGRRSASEFRLLSGTTTLDDVQILNNLGTQTYTGVYGGSVIHVSENLTSAPVAANYTLQFVQNQAGNGTGVRVIEFDSYAPEPSTFALGLSAIAILLKRRKRAR